jgi:hypothetical protein
MAKTWRDDVVKANDLIDEAAESGSSWIELMLADAKLKEAKEAISSALTRLNACKTVREAKKHVRLTRGA